MDYTQHNPLGFLAPLYFLALPLIDTFYVMFLRARAGRKIYYGSPDHIPLRLRRRLGGSTIRTVLACYGSAVVLGAVGLVILFLDPATTLIVTGVVGVIVLAILIWLGRVDMEAE
jgi:UDP-GlcNAc:undecaprenyl-phosphate GlcNAc-1-phosphate transferase